MQLLTIKNWYFNLIAIFIGISIAALIVIAIELIMRQNSPDWKYNSGNNDIIVMHKYSEVYGWELKRNFKVIIDGKAVSTNKNGYRTGNIFSRDPNKTRIVVLGDSISFGYGVGDNETFAYLLEQKDRDLEVVNLSVQGYGTDQELLVLLNDGLSFQPDIVLLTFCLENDFIDNVNSKFIYDQIHLKPYFTVSNDNLILHDGHLRIGSTKKILLWLNDESILFNWLLNRFTTKPQVFRRNIADAEHLFRNNLTTDLTLSILTKMKNIVENNNAEFIILLVPSRKLIADNKLTNIIMKSEKLIGTKFIDLNKYFISTQLINDLYIDDRIHLSPKGHSLVSELIYKEIFPLIKVKRQ